MLKIDKDTLAAIAPDLIRELSKRYEKDLEEHSKTIDMPAPTTHPFIERLVRGHGGEFEVTLPPEPTAVADPVDISGIAQILGSSS